MNNAPGTVITFWGYLLVLVGLGVGAISWNALADIETSWVLRAREAAIIGGPILICGAIAIVGGFIIAALHNRD